MTVETSTSRVSYTGSGTTGPFTIPFYFLANADIVAKKVLIADGTETTLVLTTDYSLTGAGDDAGGTLTLVETLSSSYRLVIYRDPSILQENSYPRNDPFPAATHEETVDRLTMIAQRTRNLVDRSLRQPDGDSAAIAEIPPKVERASMALGFDANGDPIAVDPESAVTAAGNVTFSHSETYSRGTAGYKLRRTVNASDAPYSIAGDGVTDDTASIQAALDAHNEVEISGVTCRVDGTITVADGKTLKLRGGAALKRLKAYSASTAVVVHLKGTKSSFLGDATCYVWTENKSPGGVVCLGHLNTTTSNWNSLWWRFHGIHVYCKDFRADYATTAVTGITKANPAVVTANSHGLSNGDLVQLRNVGGMTEVNDNVYTVANKTANTFELSGVNSSSYTTYTSGGIAQLYPALTDGVGVYIPSSQPELGSSYANYYGALSDITVHNATIPYWFTDSSNAHTLDNTRFEFTYHYGYRFNGAYGNSGTVGFCNGAYKNGAITFFFGPKLNASAPYAPSHESSRNVLYAGAVELYTTGNYGVYVNNANCVANTVIFQWNSTGDQYYDVSGTSAGTLNTVMTYTENNIPYITGLEVTAGTQVSTPIIRSPSTSYPQSISILPKFSGAGVEYGVVFSGGAEVYPNVDNTSNLGKSSFRWATVYAATGTINTSDENEKDSIKPIDDAALRAWGRVQYSQFKFRDAVAKKGDGARWHFGLVAQRVKEAFEAEGLDAFEYGLLCFDEWDDQEEQRDDEGRIVVPGCKAGSRYGVRYEEALALECAYLRSQLGKS